jgi:hypothetical protein
VPSPDSPGIRELGLLRGGPRVSQCAEEAVNFWRYLRPDEPDPSPAEVRAEQKARCAELARKRENR